MTAMPPGTDCFQAELAPSGHMVVPCCEYGPPGQEEEHSLTLLTRPPGLDRPTGPKKEEEHTDSSTTGHTSTKHASARGTEPSRHRDVIGACAGQ